MNRMESIKHAHKYQEAKHPHPHRKALENRVSTIAADLQAKSLLSSGFCASDIARTLGVTIEFVQQIELDQYEFENPRKRARSADSSPNVSPNSSPVKIRHEDESKVEIIFRKLV